ncbi:MAG: aminotransferase class V-fold PLP-dependent enzyme [Chitinophagales bacterium]|nr:aminotransferase class V-fold PLP-dependent enzyme [Chitinophagaceae bacterium]MBP9882176.1 aminotransferase class V-fold PLP-dependent enzyme [Chitinophagales bacterium]
MSSRRRFLQQSTTALLTTVSIPAFSAKVSNSEILAAQKLKAALSPEDFAKEEEFWAMIREAYTVSATIINLNNGGVSPQPQHVQEMQYKYIQMSNEAPSHYMWHILDQGREPLRQKLAELAGCLTEEVAIDRNATEALETVIFGLNLKAGDEVILTKQDYPNMVNAWKQREQRDGIKLVWLNLELPAEDDNYFVQLFSNAVTDKTRLVHVTHMINWMGQILPVKKIADSVKKKNAAIEILSDSAHTFGHFDYTIPELGCDYWGTSLHKWLCAPFGTGMLWVKKEKIPSIWPLFANGDPQSANIRKFEAQGTRSFPAEQAIAYAVDFHNAIGSQRKEARLRYLKNYWAEKVKDVPKVKLHTSLKDAFSCAICGFSVEGIPTLASAEFLFSKYKIHAVNIEWENIKCVRITPHVYTSLKDLDKLVVAIKDLATNGRS